MASASRSGSSTRRMTHQIGLRVDAATYAAIGEKAAELGVDRGAYLRDLVLRDIQRRRARPTPRFSAQEMAALASLATAVGRAAGAMIQLAKSLRETGAAPGVTDSVNRLHDEFHPSHVVLRDLLRGLKA